ncbi:MAG: UDP-N-acetylmuramate:L-alanyl-gamma-D-glutamyl-meso-diaminopimelate ligase [Desulfotignum sp.]|nr:UDP-N-acetylmuramate:L-alanyl-gamma-D-glutamyl-meso-diaminopimelate ligase [Desulfotignum sp.]MCF8125924.1 UDP-N-acetylmuramate:L-alanyl-gamma-D-glutamyl-meso-diaminopimelate ligase [Desulfotignum sp.]
MARIRKIHLTAACGTGMGTLACMLKQMGYEVTGSDHHVYPPMSDFLAASDIQIFDRFDPSNLDHDPDLVIIGNAVTRDNPEAAAVLDRQIPYLSMPQAVNRFIASGKKIILVTGTHGKTTTAAIMAHILAVAGLDPGFMIGGILKDYQSGFRIGKGDYMVIEGDEYDTAFFDKGPKFMHYDPFITIMTGVEFDHADIFQDLDHVKQVFAGLVAKVADAGHMIACKDSPHLMDILADQAVKTVTYGTRGDWSFTDPVHKDRLTRARIQGPGQVYDIETRLPGYHNLMNFLACAAAARVIGVNTGLIQKAMASFSGVRRRQEIRGIKNKITVMDDFAHHPSAVKATIHAVKPFYSTGRVIAVFEPRTNTSMRSFFQNTYPAAFKEADMVCICKPSVKKNIPENERFLPEKLVSDITALGVDAYYFSGTDEVLAFLSPLLAPEDLVLIMSNGGFDNIHTRLLEMIE